MATTAQFSRSVPQLYRDCLRLIHHVAPGTTSPKARALRATVRSEFRKPVVAGTLESRKANAVRALSNYMLAVAAPQDETLKAPMQDFHGRSVHQAQQRQRQDEAEGKTTTTNNKNVLREAEQTDADVQQAEFASDKVQPPTQ